MLLGFRVLRFVLYSITTTARITHVLLSEPLTVALVVFLLALVHLLLVLLVILLIAFLVILPLLCQPLRAHGAQPVFPHAHLNDTPVPGAQVWSIRCVHSILSI